MNVADIMTQATEAYELRPAREINGTMMRFSHFLYVVPGTSLSIYIFPVDRRISTRKLHLRFQFEIAGKRVSRDKFEAAVAAL